MATKKKAAAKKAPKQQKQDNPEAPQVASMQFWLGVVRGLLPKEKDDWKLMEVATALRLETGLLATNWGDINRIAENSGDVISVSWSFKIDRSKTPALVKVGGSYSEKHPMKAESDVADPNQDILPGLTDEDLEKSNKENEEPESDGVMEAEEEVEAPRIKTADEEIAEREEE